jgi:hypothetical protein
MYFPGHYASTPCKVERQKEKLPCFYPSFLGGEGRKEES